MTAQTTDVLVVGGAGVDTIVRVEALPVPFADSHVVPPIDTVVGHTGSGVALGCHRLGLATRFVDVIGDDHEGRMLLDRFAAEGLSFDHVVHESGTRRAVNLVDAGGRRMSFYDPRHPYDLSPDPALWRGALEQARHLHASIMPWTVAALEDATAAGVTTSTDLHDWDGHQPHHRPFAYAADLVFVSGSRLAGIEGDVVSDVLDRGRARLVVVMDGARGSRVTVRDGGSFAVPAIDIPGRPAVDSNGAGDAYVSAFLHSWLAGGDAHAAARSGTIAGAWACGTPGTHSSLIDPDELDRQLAARR
ncbi:hypothetical protein GCM10009868_04770 [Terrabacter aerolatus]|uniref:Carbohydrate kinase PfkB domain-containing protein n=1 Tax=Terrabacter aerolatus TaxID=422442 RepID=A0A512CZ55_9MICO|nr:carbohydrate kinase family protein [Terrabacter aerolatus]GEO29501.1 hypothetical protein TAE01_13110 [Terrabacter aerolatus]